MKQSKVLLILFLSVALLAFSYDAGKGKVVPSKLSDFTVYGKEDHVKVTWVTHGRDEITAFEIQRSKDGRRFEALSALDDIGTAPSTMEFFEIDNTPLLGWSYYRIMQLLEKGDTAYSGIAPVFFGLDRIKKGKVIAAKNPLDEVVKVELSDFHDEQVLLVLRNADGTEYYINQKLRVKGGRLSIQAGTEVPQGIYVITASSKDELVGLEIFADL